MINVFLELLMLTAHTSHTCQSPHKMGFTILITTSTFRGVSGYCQTKPANKSFTCLETYLETNSWMILHLFGNESFILTTSPLQFFFWTKPLKLGGPPPGKHKPLINVAMNHRPCTSPLCFKASSASNGKTKGRGFGGLLGSLGGTKYV